jgi:hypothetical protein
MRGRLFRGVVIGVACTLLSASVIVAKSGAGVAAQAERIRLFDAGLATRAPCSQITWTYAVEGEQASSDSLLADIETAVAILGSLTGLTFVETEPGAVADLRFGWSSLADYPAGTQAVGSRSAVTFAMGAEMTRNKWAGFRPRLAKGRFGSFEVGSGRGWLVIHEVMHALGFAHSDEPGSVMAPIATIVNVGTRADGRRALRDFARVGFAAGDHAALAALYPRLQCDGPTDVTLG